ncbi:DnaD domain protein [Exiguobacterium sp. MMG028]|uniref:DnaD domain-containing protein n=1 Tax=Exiguobacterium sp. MMG028 TaxID=3021979 RepID=UPI0022FE042D|nr:DnaD domain protein [Exiguobacterium sp. MMG028]MDA5561986.1 DnaD domain protein [Exiguobacterium sp. MMG028]
MKLTGNEIVDAMVDYAPPSIAIPSAWFKTVVNDKGRPNTNAIIILAEIVYWYRPSQLKDEVTGEFLGYKKRFKEDLLQKSRKGFEKTFALTKDQVYTALKFLEELGVIKTHLRHVETNTMTLNNVRFIELVPARLKELTYPVVPERDPIVQKREGYRIDTRPLSYKNETNTVITNTGITSTSNSTTTGENEFQQLAEVYMNKINQNIAAVHEFLEDDLQEFGLELLIEAINEAALSNIRNYKYVRGILNGWKDRGVTTMQGLIQDRADFEQKKQTQHKRKSWSPTKETAMKDAPAWLEEEANKQREHDKRRQDELAASVPDDEELQKMFAELRGGS